MMLDRLVGCDRTLVESFTSSFLLDVIKTALVLLFNSTWTLSALLPDRFVAAAAAVAAALASSWASMNFVSWTIDLLLFLAVRLWKSRHNAGIRSGDMQRSAALAYGRG